MGKLIVLEGTDGCGKTTQLGLLCEKLDREGKTYRKLEFPCYNDDSSMLVRMYLGGKFGKNPGDVNAFAASSFYAVDRYASYKSYWEKDYNSGMLFVSGRYTTSNAIHQGAKLDGEERIKYMDWLFDYEYGLLALPKPDAVILLDVKTETAIANITGRGNERDIHETDVNYLTRCRESALQAAERFGWNVIDCSPGGVMDTPENIAAKVAEITDRVLKG